MLREESFHIKSSSPKSSSYVLVSATAPRLTPARVVLLLAALDFLPPFSAAFSSFSFSLLRAVSVLAIFLIWSLGRSLASCLENSWRKMA